MSGADRMEDGFPHGTVEGYLDGCRGGSCPAGIEHGLSCRKAKLLAAGDYRYQRLVSAGHTPAQIATLLADPTTPTPDPTPKENPMPTPTDAAKTSKPLTVDPVPEISDDVVDEPAPTTPKTPRRAPAAPLEYSTDRWTDGLKGTAKTAKLHEIREWARANGHTVPDHGRIPQAALAAYARFEGLIAASETPAGVSIAGPTTTATAPAGPATPDAAQPLAESSQDTGPQEDAGAPAIAEEAPAERTPAAEAEEMGHPVELPDPELWEAAAAMIAEPIDEHDAEISDARTCRVCGCTDWDCAECIERTGTPCSWVEADLCSACVPVVAPPEFDEAMGAARLRAEIEQLPTPVLYPSPGPRPEWADVTIPEDIERARSLAARLWDENVQLQNALNVAIARWWAQVEENNRLQLALTVEKAANATVVAGAGALVRGKLRQASEYRRRVRGSRR